jgi:hypothetical protein
MKPIIMESKPLVVRKIIKKTTAKMFKDLEVGSQIQFSIEAKKAGFGGWDKERYNLRRISE